jgi:pimeloyl-ACP methyl ester carboxylesterase
MIVEGGTVQTPEQATVEVNGIRLYYELHGSGEPLALVHGSWGDATGWEFVMPSLAESFHVLRRPTWSLAQRAV